MPRPKTAHPAIHMLEPRRLLAAVAVADLHVSDIPDPAGGDLPGAVVNDIYYFPVQWERGRPFFPPRFPTQLFCSDGTPGGTFPLKTFDSDYVLSDLTSIKRLVVFLPLGAQLGS